MYFHNIVTSVDFMDILQIEISGQSCVWEWETELMFETTCNYRWEYVS